MLTGNENCVNIFKLSYDSKLFLENCISETHQAVNHRKKDLQISKEIEEIEPTAS